MLKSICYYYIFNKINNKESTLSNFFLTIVSRCDEHFQELLHGASVAFVLKILAAGSAFGLNVILARMLGAEGSGFFFLALSIVLVVATVGRIGMENSLVKFIAASVVSEHPGKVLGVYKKALLYSFVASAFLSTLLVLFAPWISKVIFSKPELEAPLSIMAIAVVPLALLTLHAYALQGLKKIGASISVLSVFVPFFTCIFVLPFAVRYGINVVASGYLLATIITLIMGRWFWLRAIHSFKYEKIEFASKELLSSSIPLLGVAIMNLVINWSPMVFLGIWESAENIGIYSAASRTAMLTSFVLVAINSIAAPQFAAFYQQGDLNKLEKVARNSTTIMVIFATPVLLLFLVVPEWILSIFGEQFKQGAIVLMILASAQFVNVVTGSVGYLLMMSGNERLMRNILFFCSIQVILLNLCLVPNFGMTGGAISVAVALASQNRF